MLIADIGNINVLDVPYLPIHIHCELLEQAFNIFYAKKQGYQLQFETIADKKIVPEKDIKRVKRLSDQKIIR